MDLNYWYASGVTIYDGFRIAVKGGFAPPVQAEKPKSGAG